jgi:hypothetical protein
MDGRVVAAVAALLACVGIIAPAVAAQPAESPTITISADADPLAPGEVHHTPTDPLVRVQVSADTPVSLVEVRIDGTTRHAFEPSSERVDRSVSLDLETGRHRLTVVARGDGAATREATLVKDDAAPTVNYSAPFDPEASSDDPATPPATELTVTRGNVSVDGTLADLSGVTVVRVDHAYDYRAVSGTEREGRRQYLLASPGDAFAQSLSLTPGSNTITVRAEDAVGNVRTHEFTVAVDDGTAPTLSITDVEWVSETRLHVEGRATDRVQVGAVWLESGDSSGDEGVERHPLVFPQGTAPDRDRRNVTVDTTVYHPPGTDYVVLGANDTAGNERTWNYSLSRFLAPNVTVDGARTGYVDDRTVAVGGRVADGQVRAVSVETVDPATGRIVDIRPVDCGPDGAFTTRLGAVPDRTVVRVRVRDASGAEHLTNATVTGPLEPTTPAAGADDSTGGSDESGGDTDGAGTDADTAGTEATDEGGGGVRIPLVGVVVPVPSVDIAGALSARVSLPVPVVGPIEVPVLAAGVPVVFVVTVAARRRARGG